MKSMENRMLNPYDLNDVAEINFSSRRYIPPKVFPGIRKGLLMLPNPDLQIGIHFKWQDMWIGAYVDSDNKILHICILPCLPVSIRLKGCVIK
jgi:hypothetical protein